MTRAETFASTFREEAAELLAEMETGLLELESHPDDLDCVDRVFRAMHTVKGSGAMFGFDDVSRFTHGMETAFDKVRGGELAVTPTLIGLALRGKDLVRAMLAGTADPEAVARLSAELLALTTASAPIVRAPPRAARLFRVRFRPAVDLFRDGSNPLPLLAELRDLGDARVTAITTALPPLEEMDPESCYFGWDVVLETERGAEAIRDVFIFVEDQCELRIEEIADVAQARLGEILVERGDVRPEDVAAALASQQRIGALLTGTGVVCRDLVESAAAEQKVVRQVREAAAEVETNTSIRVSAARLDSLVDLVGELVIAQARLSQTAGRIDNPDLVSIAEEMERLAGELRDNALDLRMIPIGSTFSRFKRLVRDLATSLGKEIDLVTDGAETELDKTVMEHLGDPLVHVIRNSCDHGIEGPAERAAAGKAPRGTVRLAAYQSGSSVVIEISDDGAGLDPNAIRAKAVERGLLAPDATPSDRDLFQLIFKPGFSTAKVVSNVSGRGVGMDVVKRAIDGLRGAVEVESVRGVGMTIRFRLPLTLAIIDGLLVGVGESSYVLPMSVVEECVELTREDVRNAHGNRLAAVRGELVPYLTLRDWYGIDGARPDIEQVVITGVEGNRFGLVVDGVIGQHQTVIKTLGRFYRKVEGLSGATILGDGTVALIVDVPTLVRAATSGQQEAVSC